MPKTWAQYCYLSKDPNDLDFDHMVTIDDDSGVLGYVGPIIGCPDNNDSQEISAWVCPEEREHYYGMLQLWKPIQLLGNTCSISWDDTLQWNLNYYKEREPDSAYPFHQLLATFIDRQITLSDYEKWMHSSYDTLDLSAGSYTMSQDGVYGHAQAAQRMLDMWLRVEQEKSDLGQNVLQRLSFFAASSPMAESLALDNPQEFKYASLCRLLTTWITVQNPELEGWRLAVADHDVQRLYLLESPRPLEFKISLKMYENWLRLKDAATHLQIPTSPQQLVQAESSIPSVIEPQLLRRSAVSSCAKGDVAVQEILQAVTPPRGHHRVEQKARKSGGGERPQQRMETRGVTPEVRAERAAFAQEYAEILRSSVCTRAACKLAQIATAAAAGIHDSTDCCRSIDSSSSNSSSNNSSGQSSSSSHSSSSDSSRSSSRSSRRSNKRFKGV